MTIHHFAERFADAADAYERGRPDYPPAALAIVVDALGITPDSTVVDLAAGTGKFTRLLLSTGAHVIAVEPVDGMRTKLQELLPHVETRAGTAEAMPFDDASVDAVTVAQAFHWFRGDEALAEIHRVLRPAGGLALIWNRRDMDQPIQQQIQDLVAPYRGDAPAHRSNRWRDAFARTTLFTPLEERTVPWHQEVDTQALIDRVVSISFIAALPDDERAEVAERAGALARDLPARFHLDYVTEVYWCRAREV